MAGVIRFLLPLIVLMSVWPAAAQDPVTGSGLEEYLACHDTAASTFSEWQEDPELEAGYISALIQLRVLFSGSMGKPYDRNIWLTIDDLMGEDPSLAGEPAAPEAGSGAPAIEPTESPWFAVEVIPMAEAEPAGGSGGR